MDTSTRHPARLPSYHIIRDSIPPVVSPCALSMTVGREMVLLPKRRNSHQLSHWTWWLLSVTERRVDCGIAAARVIPRPVVGGSLACEVRAHVADTDNSKTAECESAAEKARSGIRPDSDSGDRLACPDAILQESCRTLVIKCVVDQTSNSRRLAGAFQRPAQVLTAFLPRDVKS